MPLDHRPVVRDRRIELLTSSMSTKRSTTELIARINLMGQVEQTRLFLIKGNKLLIGEQILNRASSFLYWVSFSIIINNEVIKKCRFKN